MDLRRLCCAGLCACGAALVVLVVPSLRFILASQAGLVIGWRIAAMPPNILTGGAPKEDPESSAARDQLASTGSCPLELAGQEQLRQPQRSRQEAGAAEGVLKVQ